MSDMNQIRGKLAKLISGASRVECGWRRIGEVAGEVSAAAVIEELDETLFPRRLTFRNGDGAMLCLEAGNRRLRRFLPPAPEMLAGVSHLFDDDLSGADTGVAGQIVGMLNQFMSDAPDVAVHSSDIPGQDGTARAGISASELAKAFAAGATPLPTPDWSDAVAAFEQEMIRHSTAWARLQGDQVIAASDPAVDPGFLSNARDTGLSCMSDQAAVPRCLALGRSCGAETAAIVVAHAETTFVATTVSLAVEEINTRWQAAINGAGQGNADRRKSDIGA